MSMGLPANKPRSKFIVKLRMTQLTQNITAFWIFVCHCLTVLKSPRIVFKATF